MHTANSVASWAYFTASIREICRSARTPALVRPYISGRPESPSYSARGYVARDVFAALPCAYLHIHIPLFFCVAWLERSTQPQCAHLRCRLVSIHLAHAVNLRSRECVSARCRVLPTVLGFGVMCTGCRIGPPSDIMRNGVEAVTGGTKPPFAAHSCNPAKAGCT